MEGHGVCVVSVLVCKENNNDKPESKFPIKSKSHLRTGTLGDEAAACPGPGAASGQTVILAPEAEVILACNTLP